MAACPPLNERSAPASDGERGDGTPDSGAKPGVPLPAETTLPPVAPVAAMGAHARALGQQLLIYTPDGPVGGTFACIACAAQAWQPELLGHAPGCPYRPLPGPGEPLPPPVTGR